METNIDEDSNDNKLSEEKKLNITKTPVKMLFACRKQNENNENTNDNEDSLFSNSNNNNKIKNSNVNLMRRNKKIKFDKNSNTFLQNLSVIKCSDEHPSRKSSNIKKCEFYKKNDFSNNYNSTLNETLIFNEYNTSNKRLPIELYDNNKSKLSTEYEEPIISEDIIKQTDYSELLGLNFFNDIADIDCLDFLKKKKSFFDSRENIDINNIIKNQILEISLETKNTSSGNNNGLNLEHIIPFCD